MRRRTSTSPEALSSGRNTENEAGKTPALRSEGLGIDEIAPVFQIHRATAARRLAKAREEISTRARSLLVSRLKLTESECASIMGMILSQLDVSIVRVLSERDE